MPRAPSRKTELNFDDPNEPVEAHPERDPSTYKNLSLLEFIPAASPMLASPTHLAPMTELIEKAYKGKIRSVISVPCQHGKTTVLIHAVPWLLIQHPNASIVYATYGQQFSSRQSRDMRRVAKSCGVSVRKDHDTLQEWRLDEGGGLLSTSVDGELTGHPAHIIFIDDPYKNREDAENPEYRAKVEDWMRGTVLPRLAPGGSIFIVASRWHAEDLSGKMIEKGWTEVRLAAINDDGEDPNRELGAALCPWGPDPEFPRDLEFLQQLRDEVGEYDWESLFQGRPRPRSGAIFKDATLYDELPTGSSSAVLGFDFAHSVGPRADWSVIVRILRFMLDGVSHYYITDVWRWRSSVDDSEPVIRARQTDNPGAQLVWYTGNAEKATVQMFAMLKPPIAIYTLPAWSSKYVRSVPTSKLWAQGRIHVPRGAPWVPKFLSEVCGFTGNDKDKDDQLDGMVAGVDYFEARSVGGKAARFTSGSRRM